MEKNQFSLFKSLPGSYLLLEARSCHFTVVAATEALLKAVSSTAPALVGRGVFEILSAFPIDFSLHRVRQLADSLSSVLEKKEAHTIPLLQGTANDSATTYWRIENAPHFDNDGQLEFIISSIEDITAEVLAEKECNSLREALTLHQDQAQYLFDHNPEPAFSFDKEGRFLTANRALEALSECPRELIIGESFLPFIVPADQERSMYHFQEALNGKQQDYQVTAISANGRQLPILVSNIPLKVNGEVTGVYGVVRNITDLVHSQQQYQSVVNTINGIVWEADPKTYQFRFVSSQAEKMLGYPVKEWLDNPRCWIDNIHPDDREFVINTWTKHLQLKQSYEFEFRMFAADGRVVWLKDYVTLIYEDEKLVFLHGIMVDITESKHLEKVLSESVQRYSNLIQNSLDGVYKSTPDGKFLEVNPAMVKMLGYESVEELLNIDIKTELYFEAEERESALLEETREEMATFRLRRKDGSAIWVEDHGQLVLNDSGEVIFHEGIIRDVSERKKAEAELAASREALLRSNDRFKYASRATADGIWDWDLESNKVFREENFSKILGYPLEVVNSDDFVFSNCLHPDDSERIEKKIQAVLQSDVTHWTEEFKIRKADGSYAYVVDRGVIVRDGNGRAYRVIGALQDITKQKEAEYEREHLIQTLTVNNKDLQQFSYITSHNLKAPLANLISILSLLDFSKIADEETLFLLDGLTKSAEQLNETVDDLVKILVIKERVNIEQEMLVLEETWKRVENLTSGLIREAEAEVHMDFDEAPEVYFNNTYLESILLNLFSNALKYRADDRQCRIEICSREDDDHVLLSVKDNGLGIDLQRYDKRIFGLYQRFHNHPDSRGLGLYIIASQIKALGGRIEVESKVNEGTCFKVYFKKGVEKY